MAAQGNSYDDLCGSGDAIQSLEVVSSEFSETEAQGPFNEEAAVEAVKERWPGWPGKTVYRMLMLEENVRMFIGPKGANIRTMRDESRAYIKVLDGPIGQKEERVVLICATEVPDSALPPAVDGLLMVHSWMLQNHGGLSTPISGSGGIRCTRMLIPDSQAGSLVGSGGHTVRKMSQQSGCLIRVYPKGDVPVFGLQDDRVLELRGDIANVRQALVRVALHLRKFLVDPGVIPLFERNMVGKIAAPMNTIPRQLCCPPQESLLNFEGGPDLGHEMLHLPRDYVNSYPLMGPQHSVDPLPPLSRQVEATTQITRFMQIPLLYADAVIGPNGSRISYVRRTTGAIITAQQTRGLPDEMTMEICGTASQVHTSWQLLQTFLANTPSSSSRTHYMVLAPSNQAPDLNSVHGQDRANQPGS